MLALNVETTVIVQETNNAFKIAAYLAQYQLIVMLSAMLPSQQVLIVSVLILFADNAIISFKVLCFQLLLELITQQMI